MNLGYQTERVIRWVVYAVSLIVIIVLVAIGFRNGEMDGSYFLKLIPVAVVVIVAVVKFVWPYMLGRK